MSYPLRSGKQLFEPSNGKGKTSKEKSEDMPVWAEHLERALMGLDNKMNNNTSELKSFRQSLQTIEENILSLNTEFKESKRQIVDISTRLKQAQRKIVDLEAKSCRNNICILGLQEGSENGNLLDYFASLFQSLFPDILSQPPDIERAHRIFTSSDKARPILVNFLRFKVKDQIIKCARKQKVFKFNGSEIRFYEDYPWEVMEQRIKFISVMKIAHEKRLFPSLRYPARLKLFPKDSTPLVFFDPQAALDFVNSIVESADV